MRIVQPGQFFFQDALQSAKRFLSDSDAKGARGACQKLQIILF